MKKDSQGWGKKKSDAKGLEKEKKKVILFTWSPATEKIIGDRIRYWAPPDHLFPCIHRRHKPNQRSNENKCFTISVGFRFQFKLVFTFCRYIHAHFFLTPSSYFYLAFHSFDVLMASIYFLLLVFIQVFQPRVHHQATADRAKWIISVHMSPSILKIKQN